MQIHKTENVKHFMQNGHNKRNGIDLREAGEINKRWKEYIE